MLSKLFSIHKLLILLILKLLLYYREAPNCINSYKIVHKVIKNLEDNSRETHSFHVFGKEDCLFDSIPKILEFYSAHYLNQSPLVKPAFYHKKVLALYDFLESDDSNEDLYFKKNEILTILEYTQGSEWWKAMNRLGHTGLIPVTLIRRLNQNEWTTQNIQYDTNFEELKLNEKNKDLTDDDEDNNQVK